MKDVNCKVFVTCETYNQSIYIKDAMDGFCMQQTDFPFVCAVVDDASTDGEADFIQRYMVNNFELSDSVFYRYDETDDYRRVFAQHKTNKNCFFLVIYLKYNHYQIRKSKFSYMFEWQNSAEYQAACEGDDFWIDSLKLQKQVDFMESHPEHSLCFCAHQRLLPSGETVIVKRYESDVEICSMEDIILGGGGYMATNSMLYRESMYVPHTIWTSNCPVGDGPTMLTLAAKGKVGYLSDIMCVYRVTAEGSWSVRMRSDYKRRKQHHKDIIKMWHQYDKWTNFKYHSIIRQKININRKNYFRGKLRELKSYFLGK